MTTAAELPRPYVGGNSERLRAEAATALSSSVGSDSLRNFFQRCATLSADGGIPDLGRTPVGLSSVSLVSSNADEAAAETTLLGMPAISCTSSSASGQVFIAEAVLDSPLDLRYVDTFQLPIQYSDFEAAGGVIQVWLYVGTASTRPQIPLDNLRPNAVNTLSISRDIITSGSASSLLDTGPVTKIRVVVVSPSAPSADVARRSFTVGLPRVGARGRGVVSWYIDGPYTSTVDLALPAFNARGIKANIALTVSSLGTGLFASEADALAAADDGHLLCHHTFGVATTGYGDETRWPTREAIRDDIRSTWAWLQARGRDAGIGHAVVGYTNYWNGSTSYARSQDIDWALTEAGVVSLRRGGTFSASASSVGLLAPVAGNPTFVPTVGGIQITDSTTVASIKAAIDAAISRGELVSFVLHHVSESTPASLTILRADLEEVLDYAAQKEAAGLLSNSTIDRVVNNATYA